MPSDWTAFRSKGVEAPSNSACRRPIRAGVQKPRTQRCAEPHLTALLGPHVRPLLDLDIVRSAELTRWAVPGTGLVLIDTAPESGLPHFRFGPDTPEIALATYPLIADRLRAVLADIRAMLVALPEVTAEPARARFTAFPDSALEIFAYLRTTDDDTDMAVRADGMLPLPEMDGGMRGELMDTLPYPPEGSAQSQRPPPGRAASRLASPAHLRQDGPTDHRCLVRGATP